MSSPAVEQWRKQRLTHWATQAWAEGLSEVLAALALSDDAEQIRLEPREPDPAALAGWAEPLWFEIEFDLADAASFKVGLPKESAAALAALIGSDSPDEVSSSCEDLVNQTALALSSAITLKIGHKVKARPAASSEPPEEAELGVEFRFPAEGAERTMALVPSVALVDALPADEPAEEEQQPPAAEVEQKDAGLSVGAAGAGGGSGGGGGADGNVALSEEEKLELPAAARRNLAMLLDVELDLSVSFGRTLLPLEDVLKLTSGSIVELNRSATDPVDVLVNDSVVARGEVVVVDGNYGVRITEVVSRRERIRSLF